MTPSPRAQNAPAPTRRLDLSMSVAEGEVVNKSLNGRTLTPEEQKIRVRYKARLKAALEGPR